MASQLLVPTLLYDVAPLSFSTVQWSQAMQRVSGSSQAYSSGRRPKLLRAAEANTWSYP
jgi:hypothetical protein